MQPIADQIYFAKHHILAHRQKAPSVLAEQAVHCLELVAELSREGLSYRFKGGNSLLLLLPEPRRLSIDVDISTAEPRERIEQVLAVAVEKYGVFTRWQRRQHKTKPWLPLASFEVFYRSHFSAEEEPFIFLDAQLHQTAYPAVLRHVQCGDLYRADQAVELPAVASIMGDKLLTLGPVTLGIPTGKGKEAQRLKHVYDIAQLSTQQPGLADFRRSVQLCLEQELSLQNRTMTLEEVYLDTLSLCRCAASFAAEPAPPLTPVILDEVVRGRQPFASHLFDPAYPWAALQVDLARVALCFTAVMDTGVTPAQFLPSLAQTAPWPVRLGEGVAKMKKFNVPAAYYWAVAEEWAGEALLE